MKIKRVVIAWSLVSLILCATSLLRGDDRKPLQNPSAFTSGAKDPGVRAGNINAGSPFGGLSASQSQFFEDGQARFQQVEQVADGLGPAFNSTSCSSCHAQPALGGSSPSATQYPNVGPNPQIAAATASGAQNRIPFFITADGPVREARFPFMVFNGSLTRTPDGGVHDLFTIAGRADAGSCTLAQPNFELMHQLGNLIFRISTPVFGAGLIENIADATIVANMHAHSSLKQQLGISGHPNMSGNDGSITRFGWKAQNKSLQIFAGEAYNVEMGVTNEAFPSERGAVPISCQLNATPEDDTNFDQSGATMVSDIVAFSTFSSLLPQPLRPKGFPGIPAPRRSKTAKRFSARSTATCATRPRSRPHPPASRRHSAIRPFRYSPTCLYTIWAADSQTTSRKAPRDRANSAQRRYGGSASAFSSFTMAARHPQMADS